MINMSIVKRLNTEIYQCIFYRDGDISHPIMILSDYELRSFHCQLIEEKAMTKEGQKK